MSAQNWALFFLSPNFEDVEQIDIKDISGAILLTTLPNEGCKRKFTLMKEDYITLKFSLESPIFFKLGSYVECDFGLFEVCDLQKPVFNTDNAGYDYELQLDAHYWKWKNKIFKYTPEVAGQEASWNLTASLDVQAGIVLRNLKALGYKYKGQDFVFSIDSTVENKALLMTYDNINILDACFSMAKKWDCECWVTENIIHFGRCESGDAVDFEIGKNVQEMPRSESRSTYATRIYAFGSTKNIPSDYRPVDETVVLNGVVQKRLMLPEGTPYIDAYPDMTTEEAIEQVVIFDDVYPRRVGTMSDITIKEYTDKIENADGTTTEKKWNAYRFKDTGITFSKDYILPGKELKITFQSGKLNGMEFAVTFDPEGKPEKLGNGGWNPEAQLWEIVRNEDYGRPLPDGALIPENGDTYILSGWNSMKITEMGLVAEAQLELKDKADKYVAKSKIDPSTYNCKMMSDVAYSEDGIHNLYSIGQKVNLINKAYFENGRQSRIIGFEFNLDLPYDSPIYTVGETAAYSRIGELEEKVESLTLKGQTYTGSGSSGVYVIRRNDSTPATDNNVFSALRSLAMFLRKDQADGTPFPITFGDWVKFGEFITGISGGCIDKNGILEMEEGIFRKRVFVPEIAYNRVTYFKGRMCASPGGGCTVKEWSDNGDSSYTITPDLTDADGLSQFVDDILTTYFVTKSPEGKLQGFEEMKFRVTSADYTAKTFVMTPKPGTDWKPGDAMVLAQTGNFTDEDRQTYILIDTVNGNNCITFFDHANTWDVEPAQEVSWIGKKKGRTVHGIPADNYSAVFRHVIMSGKIFQVDDITGEAFRVPLFKGTWKKGEKHAYYDEVTHDGSSWICVNEKGTSTEPADGNADWLKYAAKGESGKGIKSTDVEYAISVSNVIAPVDGWQTTSPEWEAGKYIWSRTKIVYSDDEVKYTQAACISGGQGADGKGIKSITEEYYLSSSSATTTGGEWQTDSPAWKNGWYIWTRTRIVFTDGTSTTTNAICVTGSKGADGTSITNCGEWETGKHIPYMGITKMAGRVFLCVAPDGTDNPPMWTQTTNEGRRILQTQNGGKSYGYIITEEVNTDEWEQLTSDGGMVYLISTCSNIRVSSAGSLVPSAFRVYAKRTLGSATLTYPDGYLAARGYSNGIWSAIAGPSRASEITVNASAGYSTFSVRCYQSQADASAWNDSFIAEMSVGVSYDGSSGRDASEPRPRGFFAKGNTYVWNEDYHDIVLATFNNRTIPFRVRAYGTSVTVAPTSIDGDANWEAAQQFMFVAMDMALARKIRADEILVDDLVVQNVLARDKNGNVTCSIDGETGEVNVQGKITATAAFIKIHGFSSNEGYFYLNPNFGSDFGNGRPSRIGQSEYMLPSSAQCVGMKISLIIYNNSSGSTYGYVSVVTSDGFNDMELVDGQYHYCNKAHITEPGVYEFISLGGVWISTNKNGISYSYADLGDHDYENPVN